MTDFPKRRQIGLSLSIEEGEALSRAARATGHTPTSFATALFRYAFRKYEEVNSIERLLADDLDQKPAKKRKAG